MRRFRYIGTEVQRTDYEEELPEFGESYDEDYLIATRPVSYWAQEYPSEWQEVSGGEPQVFNRVGFNEKPLHKDTDLGYFAGLAMQGILANSSDTIVNLKDSDKSYFAVLMAKELIKQLNEETK